jgi:hypothetical protein
MTIVTNAASFNAKPGQSETLGSRLLALVEATRKEPGLRHLPFEGRS